MKKDTKLYAVQLGYVDKETGDGHNWRVVNVIAEDAPAAIKRVKLDKGEYVEEVRVISRVDVK